MIRTAAELLPVHGPITSFIFLNTLQALEDLPFDEGVVKGARLFGCRAYLPEDHYREKLADGRIQVEDLTAAVQNDLGDRAHETVAGLCTRGELHLAMLQYPFRTGPAEELRWFVAETNALRRFRTKAPAPVRDRLREETRRWVMRDIRNGKSMKDASQEHSNVGIARLMLNDLLQHFGESSIERWSEQTWEELTLKALWRVCRRAVHDVDLPWQSPPPPVRHRDVLLQVTGEDSDALVHEVLIRFCAAFADQGQADWSLPHREHGFYRAFCELYRQPAGPPNRWLRGLTAEINRLESAKIGPLESIVESLKILGVREPLWDDYITSSLIALRGWASLIWHIEVRGDRVALPAPEGTLTEYLAVRLLLERLALRHVAREGLQYTGELSGLRKAAEKRAHRQTAPSFEQRAMYVFQLAQVLGWIPPQLYALSNEQWTELIAEIERFPSFDRRRLFHYAFERRYRNQALSAIAIRARQRPERVVKPRFQASFCVDTREESFRRHLEEIAPDTETFAAAGFYGVAMYYRGVADANYAALCPVVVKPKHWVMEEVVYPLEALHRQRAKTRRALGTASHRMHKGSRGLTAGAFLTGGLGVLASVPLVARVLFPRLTAKLRRSATKWVEPPAVTRLRLERTAAAPGPDDDAVGFSVEEMANIGEKMLRDIGLTHNFARLKIFFGHGSSCLNNPHKSTYDCGACCGSVGGPNARVMAAMLNDVRVREILARRGLEIPRDTYFLGALHNTGDDSLTFYDLDLLPKSHLKDFESARETLQQVCERNAHERCRRFKSAPLNLSFAQAHRHVQGRVEDLAQTRPEFGNASNTMCFVGRRERLRGLYMDRRCFLQSYDPAQDDADHTILARLLAPVVPVCEGISLMYYFSTVDSNGWGSGTKLPHNVTSLLGVMDGYVSDLRFGLPAQSVEIHEPLRCLFLVESTPAALLNIMGREPGVGRILKNGWALLAVLDPDSSNIQVYENGRFVPFVPETETLPKVTSSLDWYRGWRDHLGFALIER